MFMREDVEICWKRCYNEIKAIEEDEENALANKLYDGKLYKNSAIL